MEWAASAMEMSVISAKNAANMVHKYLENLTVTKRDEL